MFALGDSREESPNDMVLLESNDHSPHASYSDGSGNMANNSADPFSTAVPSEALATQLSLQTANQGMPPTSIQSASLSPSNSSRPNPGSKWPCLLTVEPTPDKSRVETQIPIRLTLYGAPKNFTKLHLPSYTISKPKFQCKPTHELAEDTLELKTMLVCASAMQKEGVEEIAFQRAEIEEPPGNKEEQDVSHLPENDHSRPLNGGPVYICAGCVVRERKRAARKKLKKVDEEEEWAKEEHKRAIVFNCAELRDWQLPNAKEVPVKDANEPYDAMTIHVPMRIACYCRHQSEKVGFQ